MSSTIYLAIGLTPDPAPDKPQRFTGPEMFGDDPLLIVQYVLKKIEHRPSNVVARWVERPLPNYAKPGIIQLDLAHPKLLAEQLTLGRWLCFTDREPHAGFWPTAILPLDAWTKYNEISNHDGKFLSLFQDQ
jgi:hypothetical protein